MNSTIRNKSVIGLFILTGTIFSCSQYSKNDYLRDYQQFIYHIKTNWRNIQEPEWLKFDKQNEKFSSIYYEQFVKELTASEKIKIRRFDFAYHYYRGNLTASMLLSDDYQEILMDFSKEIYLIIKELQSIKDDIRTEYMSNFIERLLTLERTEQ